jgi:hypothetical protein
MNRLRMRKAIFAMTGIGNVKRIMRHQVILSVALVLVLMNGRLNAQSGPTVFVPFNDFIASTAASDSAQYLGKSTGGVTDPQAFEGMRHYILNIYQGVQVSHSFVLGSQHFDCIPTEQQPTVRLLGLKSIASAPPDATLTIQSAGVAPQNDAVAGKTTRSASQVGPNDRLDQFGNSIGCQENTIPMERITLEGLSRFNTLKQFFEKGPSGAGRPPSLSQKQPAKGSAIPPSAYYHKYSYTYQNVNNLGGNSALNIWAPDVETEDSEIFSLSQQWYIGFGGTVQTVEGGLQNYPAFYGSDEHSNLFIYWTADDYQTTGCYNLTCAAFVQVNNSWFLGGALGPNSQWRGPQYDFDMQWYLYGGNWWLNLGGTWVGYYPGSIYRGGQLSRFAQEIEYGSESVGSWIWPPEGSGYWPSWAFGYAAYQRDLWYRDTSSNTWWDSLTAVEPSPSCYSIGGPYWSSSAGWGIYFDLGGPGGEGC